MSLFLACAVVLLARGAVAARLLLSTVTVRGGSMSPALSDGDVLLVLRGRRRVRAGRIVVVRRPAPGTGWAGPAGTGWYVKRVAAAPGDPMPPWAPAGLPDRVPPGALVLLGEHPGSEDSKQWGLCPAELMYGVMLLRLSR
ncbi:S26 family signal peptidase [Nonomuraea ceibae]|uniref:S26 family signal peptidase n=1 Tax=Nonomuraea ceibae TaxID=1935170 RepID=UPI001C5DE6E7|nr:S26 family signal peptidase [Nonomuraea ceibae]